jgi:hypothetical protein
VDLVLLWLATVVAEIRTVRERSRTVTADHIHTIEKRENHQIFRRLYAEEKVTGLYCTTTEVPNTCLAGDEAQKLHK